MVPAVAMGGHSHSSDDQMVAEGVATGICGMGNSKCKGISLDTLQCQATTRLCDLRDLAGTQRRRLLLSGNALNTFGLSKKLSSVPVKCGLKRLVRMCTRYFFRSIGLEWTTYCIVSSFGNTPYHGNNRYSQS